MKRHLNICVKIEEIVGKIYRQLATSPQLSAEVKQTLNEMASDEDEHASQLRFALRFPVDSVVSSAAEMRQKAQELLTQAEQIFLQICQTGITDQQAIEIGIKLEQNFCQAHIGNSFNFKDGQHKAMFAAMARADEEHCQRLLDLQKKLIRA
jgi:rubrerythrin